MRLGMHYFARTNHLHQRARGHGRQRLARNQTLRERAGNHRAHGLEDVGRGREKANVGQLDAKLIGKVGRHPRQQHKRAKAAREKVQVKRPKLAIGEKGLPRNWRAMSFARSGRGSDRRGWQVVAALGCGLVCSAGFALHELQLAKTRQFEHEIKRSGQEIEMSKTRKQLEKVQKQNTPRRR